MGDLQGLSTILANVATFLGIPVAIFIFLRDRRQTLQAREQETFRLLQEEYGSFLRLCLDNPELQMYDYQLESEISLPPELKKKRMIAFEILMSMLESAYYFYTLGHSSRFKERQWSGWDQYIRSWCDRKDFRDAWDEFLGNQFDKEFIDYVNEQMNARRRNQVS
jgi:hypothetical protein